MIVALFRALWRLLSGISKVISVLVPLILVSAVIVTVSVVLSESGSAPLPEKAGLLVSPVGVLVEDQIPVEPFGALLNQDYGKPTLLSDVIDSIKFAAEDASISALVLDLEQLVGPSTSQTIEISPAIEMFKESGKPVIAVGDFYTQAQYLLAAQADYVFMHPEGGMLLDGFAVYRSYIRSLLEKIRVTMHVFRVGTNKSAAEPYLRDSMSDGEKEVVGRWLGVLWSEYTQLAEVGRRLPLGTIDELITNFSERLEASRGDLAEMMVAEGLVDELLDHEQMEERLIELVGVTDDRGDLEIVDFERYLEHARSTSGITAQSQPLIAVVPVEGTLVPGESGEGLAGSDTIVTYLDSAFGDGDLAGLVLRVNSPGGSVFASEVIRRKLASIRKAGIPVVVSMGSVAASGGYWIAADADQIWALPTTLTGSIGVWSAFPTIEGIMEYIGVSVDGLGTTALAGTNRLDRELNPEIGSIIQTTTNAIYSDFLDLVSIGRKLDKSNVAEIAEGIVWTGKEALQIGLVDHLGGLDQAISAVANLGELESYRVRRIGLPVSFESLLLQELNRSFGSRAPEGVGLFAELVAELKPTFKNLFNFRDPMNHYAQCLSCDPGP